MANQHRDTLAGQRSVALRTRSLRGSGPRFRALLAQCNISPMDFAVFLKVSPQNMTNWFARGLPRQRLPEIAQLFSVNEYWLAMGEGDKHGPGYG